MACLHKFVHLKHNQHQCSYAKHISTVIFLMYNKPATSMTTNCNLHAYSQTP